VVAVSACRTDNVVPENNHARTQDQHGVPPGAAPAETKATNILIIIS
jgi:hypothetical protein